MPKPLLVRRAIWRLKFSSFVSYADTKAKVLKSSGQTTANLSPKTTSGLVAYSAVVDGKVDRISRAQNKVVKV